MVDPSTYRPAAGEIPESAGVYRFRDVSGRVIYVGKAKNLRQRLNSYFADLAGLHPRTQNMVTTAVGVEWTVVSTEVEALQLEYSWIKEYDPRFNVKYRDDKSYPYLAVTIADEFPRVQVLRGAKRKGTRYFGPYSHAWAIRETVDTLLRVFPVRTCSNGVFKRAQAVGRPCLLGYIDKCSAPCVGKVSAAEHRELAEDFCDFLAGNSGRFVRELEREMSAAAAAMDYERAARIRDDLAALKRSLERNAVVLSDDTDADVFALAQDELEAAVQVFHVRGGRIRGQRGWVVEKVEDLTTGDLVEHLLQQVYGEAGDAVPPQILLSAEPADTERDQEWLGRIRGAKVEIRVPQRGEKRALIETVERNAVQALALHKTRRASDLSTRAQALQELHEALSLPEVPLRIECYDISHTDGTEPMASMVVFEDGVARKSEYRTFAIKSGGNDDVGAIREVISRRLRRYLADREHSGDLEWGSSGPIDESTGRPKRFAYPPNLIVVDGGQPQVKAAAAAMAELGITEIAICGLAKRLEEIWVPDDEFPVILPRQSEGLYLLQRVRDEAHRFAISKHRARRGKKMTVSALDGIPGLGPSRIKALRSHFGSVAAIRAASPEELAGVSGIGPALAANVHAALAQNRPASSVNTATGEIIEE